MCGIVGIVQSSPVDVRQVARMSDLIRHRGPDDEGLVAFTAQGPVCLGGDATPSFDGIDGLSYKPTIDRDEWTADRPPAFLVLGHRRLSIIDLSPLGHQPMAYMGRYWIVFNGEVFNFVELRDELKKAGYDFRSNSDTEVILAAYDRWGPDFLDRCNGMWSMAIYDCHVKTLFLARDRFGVKPLYYRVSADGRSLAFASEIKAFSTLTDWRPDIAPQPVFDFLAWGIQDHNNRTMFKDVHQIPPGHFASISLGTDDRLPRPLTPLLETKCWYDVATKHRDVPTTFQDAAAEFRELFLDAVRLRMRADVPLGSCLSGGLDSSSIVRAVYKELKEIGGVVKQKTFSSCSDFPNVDERDFIAEATRNTDISETHVFPSGEELFERLDELVWSQDEPFISSSIFAQWCLFRAARQERVVVVLDGQGADEQLAGYHGFFGARLAGLVRRGDFGDFFSELREIRQHHGYGAAKFAEYLIANLAPISIRPLGSMRGITQMRRDWINVAALGADDRDPMFSLGARTTSVRDLSVAQINGSNLQMLLHWEDRNSMAHSTEARVPFLDYRLVEYTLNLPEAFKLKNGVTKRVLREAMKGIVPQKIVERMDKKGFLTAEEYWMKGRQANDFKLRLEEAIALSGDIINPAMRDVLKRVSMGKAGFSYHVWRVICFGAWLKKFKINLGGAL